MAAHWLIHALLGLDRVESAHKRSGPQPGTAAPVIIHQELTLACLLHQGQWEPAWALLSGLLQRCPWQPEWRQTAILLALLRRDEAQVLAQATAVGPRFFPRQKFHQSIEHCVLDATLAVLWHPRSRPGSMGCSRPRGSRPAGGHPEGPRGGPWMRAPDAGAGLPLRRRPDAAAKHPPEAARDNHLNQLLGFAVSQFCGLPQHAQRYLARLGQYRGRWRRARSCSG